MEKYTTCELIGCSLFSDGACQNFTGAYQCPERRVVVEELVEALDKAGRIVEKYKDACFEFAKESHHRGNGDNTKFWENRTKSMVRLIIEITEILAKIEGE